MSGFKNVLVICQTLVMISLLFPQCTFILPNVSVGLYASIIIFQFSIYIFEPHKSQFNYLIVFVYSNLPIGLLFLYSSFLIVSGNFYLGPFPFFCQQTLISISFNTTVLVMDYLSFYQCKTFLKNIFTRYRILGWQLFSFSLLKSMFHDLLDYIVFSKIYFQVTFWVFQQLSLQASAAGDVGSILGQGTKIPYVMQCSQNYNINNYYL